MATRREIIQLPKGGVQKIMLNQKCGKTTVYAALNGTSNSEQAKLIRQLAISDYGGVKTKKLYL